MPVRHDFATEGQWLFHLRIWLAAQSLTWLANDLYEGGDPVPQAKGLFKMADAIIAAMRDYDR